MLRHCVEFAGPDAGVNLLISSSDRDIQLHMVLTCLTRPSGASL